MKKSLLLVTLLTFALSAMAQNPYLPLWEHLPDGEPRVFEDPDNPGHYRAYIIGSHDITYTAYCVQGLAAMDNAFVCEVVNICLPTTKTTSSPVGQASTPDYVENINTLSDVRGVTHGLYLHMLPNPPNTVEIVDDS